ncbi:MAG TPA: biotin/lipoyl-binding protein [Oscillospiraceae bacterium]|nr:biotin/lipoyl-binding protein [Oscillospiraceae bacterium]HPF56802.1 biotin/lipoyl-binding protein [Clostridiales bacterium]HPK35466.1 biotin/lipoyl-binding protein [Oscillospiraceae bacterium]HPR75190.1 biotin/lipoyl-binding protein [Oscillospiraceae bacterium]
MKKFFASVLSLILVCGLISGCSQNGPSGGLVAPSSADGLTHDYVTVLSTRGDIKKVLKSTSPSTFRSTDAATAYFTVSGTIATVNVVWGTTVKAGDIIATLVEAADYKVEVAKAKQALDIAEINLNQAKTNAEGGGEVALAQLKWQQAQNEFEASGSDNEQLRLNTEILKATYENLASTAKNTYSDLQLNYDTLKIQYDQAQAKYEACFLKAPISGEITWIGQRISEGYTVSAFSQVATIENDSGFAHVYYGSSTDSQYLSVGDVVTVITTKTGVQYQGRILYAPGSIPGDINYNLGGNAESPVYFIRLIGFDYSQASNGNSGGDLNIVLQDHKDTVLVDTYLLKSYTDDDGNTAYYVNILYKDVPIRKNIIIGIKNGDYTEVLSGLEENMDVVYTPS